MLRGERPRNPNVFEPKTIRDPNISQNLLDPGATQNRIKKQSKPTSQCLQFRCVGAFHDLDTCGLEIGLVESQDLFLAFLQNGETLSNALALGNRPMLVDGNAVIALWAQRLPDA